MRLNELDRKLKQLKIEDYIWVIYVGIIFLSWYANSLERKYFIFNDLKSRDDYRKIMITIFAILVVIYFYFLQDSVTDLNNLKTHDSNQKKELTLLSAIGSLLIFISGIIFLYIIMVDEEIDVELAFN